MSSEKAINSPGLSPVKGQKPNLGTQHCLAIFRFGIKGYVPFNSCSLSSLTKINGWSSDNNDDFDGKNDDNIYFRLTMTIIMIYTPAK